MNTLVYTEYKLFANNRDSIAGTVGRVVEVGPAVATVATTSPGEGSKENFNYILQECLKTWILFSQA